ncbi:MAG: MBL fold metallo-hydrolase [Anaerotruncus sp.]|nr:MAG: MBL fold metallo-hydrolase [Anaerotruncus sp.]
MGIDPQSIKAVLVTHEHKDHISGVRVFASRYKTPVYASPATLEEMQKSGDVNGSVNSFEINGTLDLGDMCAQAFHNSHDSADCVGYEFTVSGGRKISVCTDTGYVTDDAKLHVTGSDLVFLESNHEISMLENGCYPYPLKKSAFCPTKGIFPTRRLMRLQKNLLQSGTTRFVLSHLSRENNVPEIARQSMIAALSELGAKEGEDYRLYVSKPVSDGGFIVL